MHLMFWFLYYAYMCSPLHSVPCTLYLCTLLLCTLDPLDPHSEPCTLPPPQSLRLPRALRLVREMRQFFSSIIGDGIRLLIVVLLVIVFLIWFAVVSMQIFGYLAPEAGCERVGSDQFRDFLHVSCHGNAVVLDGL